MKKYILSLLIMGLALNAEFLNAQSLNQFGIKAGVNMMGIHSKLDETSSTANKTGFFLGVFMEFIKTVDFSIQPEINYSSTDNLVNDNISLLHIPILLKYKLGNKFEIYGGPESQFLLKVSNTNIKNDNYKKFILAADLGASFLISENLSLDARYNLALSKYIDYGYNSYKKLNFIQIGLAYKFDN
ncbi:porin family protein [Lutibacter sp.]|uniref:porin family protein n=1 Tax=Lutibacter sp. TaxID=1925666 RepID=UPI001A2CF203|nr:porin family protein [Lutibacter sp.]MBI9041509.1 porin family protein [Lutibacter sp.]